MLQNLSSARGSARHWLREHLNTTESCAKGAHLWAFREYYTLRWVENNGRGILGISELLDVWGRTKEPRQSRCHTAIPDFDWTRSALVVRNTPCGQWVTCGKHPYFCAGGLKHRDSWVWSFLVVWNLIGLTFQTCDRLISEKCRNQCFCSQRAWSK